MPGCRLIGVGQDEDPEPLVRRADFCRAEQARRRRVAQSPKLSQDGFEAEGDVVIPPFLTGCGRRTYAAIFSFIAGVMPPMPMLGRSLL